MFGRWIDFYQSAYAHSKIQYGIGIVVKVPNDTNQNLAQNAVSEPSNFRTSIQIYMALYLFINKYRTICCYCGNQLIDVNLCNGYLYNNSLDNETIVFEHFFHENLGMKF